MYRESKRTINQNSWMPIRSKIEKVAKAIILDKTLSRNPQAILGSVNKSDLNCREIDELTLVSLIEANSLC